MGTSTCHVEAEQSSANDQPDHRDKDQAGHTDQACLVMLPQHFLCKNPKLTSVPHDGLVVTEPHYPYLPTQPHCLTLPCLSPLCLWNWCGVADRWVTGILRALALKLQWHHHSGFDCIPLATNNAAHAFFMLMLISKVAFLCPLSSASSLWGWKLTFPLSCS